MSALDTLTDDSLRALLDVRKAAEAWRTATNETDADEAKANLDDALDRCEGVGE